MPVNFFASRISGCSLKSFVINSFFFCWISLDIIDYRPFPILQVRVSIKSSLRINCFDFIITQQNAQAFYCGFAASGLRSNTQSCVSIKLRKRFSVWNKQFYYNTIKCFAFNRYVFALQQKQRCTYYNINLP